MFSINYVQPVGGLEYDQRHKGPGASELTQSVDTRHIDVTDIRNQVNDFNLDDRASRRSGSPLILTTTRMTTPFANICIRR